MKLITLGIAAVLAAGSVGMAQATELITNGNFTAPTESTPTQFGGSSGQGCNMSGRTWGGQFITGWNGGNYGIWYPNATAASTVNACTQWGTQTANGAGQRLPSGVTAPTSGGPAFVGLDGQNNLNAWIQQKVSVTAGKTYTVSFLWAGTQEMSTFYNHIDYPTCQWLTVSLGGDSQNTPNSNPGCTLPSEKNIPSQGIPVDSLGFTGWMPQSFTFTPTSSGDQFLKFMAYGNPGVPPFSLLADVSMTSVPEPPELAMFGIGLLGLGLLTVFARSRALRRYDADGDIG